VGKVQTDHRQVSRFRPEMEETYFLLPFELSDQMEPLIVYCSRATTDGFLKSKKNK
jgi:hypothetical protein